MIIGVLKPIHLEKSCVWKSKSCTVRFSTSKTLRVETTKNCFDRSVSNMVISMPDVFTQLNLLYRICISKISISPASHVYQISSLQFYNTYPLIVVNFCYSSWLLTRLQNVLLTKRQEPLTMRSYGMMGNVSKITLFM